ncbi:MAG: ComF family protein [Campylobacterales bacterium]|nr:ComF family protein [Campylobacterales bacterium]
MFGCIVCNSLSFNHICNKCLNGALAPTLNTREIDGLQIYSFYKYSEIEPLIKYKHKMAGSFILKRLASVTFTKFAKNFEYEGKISLIPIDDKTTHGYSHTAILANAMKNSVFEPQWGAMRAKNDVVYAGQSLEFRKNNPREFDFKGAKHKEIVLVDDIVTTGTTLLEARACSKSAGYEVLFAVTLSDARE